MHAHTLWMHVLYMRHCLCFADFAVLCRVEEAALPLGCQQLAECWIMTESVLVTLFHSFVYRQNSVYKSDSTKKQQYLSSYGPINT